MICTKYTENLEAAICSLAIHCSQPHAILSFSIFWVPFLLLLRWHRSHPGLMGRAHSTQPPATPSARDDVDDDDHTDHQLSTSTLDKAREGRPTTIPGPRTTTTTDDHNVQRDVAPTQQEKPPSSDSDQHRPLQWHRQRLSSAGAAMPMASRNSSRSCASARPYITYAVVAAATVAVLFGSELGRIIFKYGISTVVTLMRLR